jgi:hypothetical protein
MPFHNHVQPPTTHSAAVERQISRLFSTGAYHGSVKRLQFDQSTGYTSSGSTGRESGNRRIDEWNLLEGLEKLRVQWPIPEATLQIMFAINNLPGCSTITSRLTADPGSSVRTVALRSGSLVQVDKKHE